PSGTAKRARMRAAGDSLHAISRGVLRPGGPSPRAAIATCEPPSPATHSALRPGGPSPRAAIATCEPLADTHTRLAACLARAALPLPALALHAPLADLATAVSIRARRLRAPPLAPRKLRARRSARSPRQPGVRASADSEASERQAIGS